MMYSEFMRIAGYEVTYDDYKNFIEPMYTALPVTKQDFVAMVDRNRFEVKRRKESDIIRDMKRDARKLYKALGHTEDLETEDHLELLRKEYESMFWSFEGAWTYLDRMYEYPGKRGCSFPFELVIMYSGTEFRRVNLIDI